MADSNSSLDTVIPVDVEVGSSPNTEPGRGSKARKISIVDTLTRFSVGAPAPAVGSTEYKKSKAKVRD